MISRMQYHIWTIGCQMNKAESAKLGSYFEGLGYQITDSAAEADLIVLNSCVVRQHAESRVVNKLHALKSLKQANPNLTLAVTGCLVNADNAELRERFEEVYRRLYGRTIPGMEVEILSWTLSLTAADAQEPLGSAMADAQNGAEDVADVYLDGSTVSTPVLYRAMLSPAMRGTDRC